MTLYGPQTGLAAVSHGLETEVPASAAAPGKATAVSANTPSDKRFVLDFTVPAGATKIFLAYGTTAAAAVASAEAGPLVGIGGTSTVWEVEAGNAYSYYVTEIQQGSVLANGTTYYVIPVPGNSDNVFHSGDYASGDAVSATPVGAPSAPTLNSATAGNALVTLSVTAASASDVIYARYWTPDDTAPSAESESWKRTGSGTITITGLTNDRSPLPGYWFQVYAKNESLTSAWSVPKSARPTAGGAADIEEVIYEELLADSTVQTAVGRNSKTGGYQVYHITAPALQDGASYPYLTFQIVDDAPPHHMGGASNVSRVYFQVDAWGADDATTKAAADAARLALDALQRVKRGSVAIRGIEVKGMTGPSQEFAGDGRQSGPYRRRMDFVAFVTLAAPSH